MTTGEYLKLYDKFPRPFWKKREKWEGSYFGATRDWFKIRKFNKELIANYPWLLPRNRWTDDVPEDYDYTYTELDQMPTGWRLAFGDQLCEELGEELFWADYEDKYRILQVKEKFGGLRWYDNGCTEAGNKIIDKYERLSYRTCICCGKPAKYMTLGWISPFCEDCIKDINDSYCTLEEYFDNGSE